MRNCIVKESGPQTRPTVPKECCCFVPGRAKTKQRPKSSTLPRKCNVDFCRAHLCNSALVGRPCLQNLLGASTLQRWGEGWLFCSHYPVSSIPRLASLRQWGGFCEGRVPGSRLGPTAGGRQPLNRVSQHCKRTSGTSSTGAGANTIFRKSVKTIRPTLNQAG